ncbi:hypothetical protein ACEK07_04190 [Alcanivoracaceae bacterium MT1]
MAKAPKHCIALDDDLQESPWGRLFVDDSTGDTFDLRGVNVIHFGTDTVRQLYRGRLQPHILALFEEPGIVDFAGKRWSAGRIGRDSGYQYRLQNADLGVILLIKSFHAKDDAIGTHLKIEVSPHCIQAHSPRELQILMDDLADQVLTHATAHQAAVHIAMDVQGWAPPQDFQPHLHCRSRRVRQYDGIDNIEWASASATYGRGESWLFGSPSGIQLAVYDKTKEAIAKDKLDYWRSVWSQADGYQEERQVFRIEFRFHHSIVEQFSQGSVDYQTGAVVDFHDYASLHDHLDALWRYGCDAYRYLRRPGLYDPFWTVVSRQALPLDPQPVKYKRYHKTASGFSGKNVELLLGNFISCAARHRLSACQAWKALESLPFFDVIEDHYRAKGKSTYDLRRHIRQLLEERIVRWGQAI